VRILVIAAHPDDETIGASALIGPPHHAIVLHITDGAPRDRRWWPAGIDDRLVYARVRALEAERALAHVHARRVALGLMDQEVVHALPCLVRVLAAHVERCAPDLIVTHAYEGGHPDHDAVALAVSLARDLVARPPPLYEMALYHGAGGGLVTGDFIGGGPSIHHALDPEQQARRRAMLACFASQAATLAPFAGLAHERYRAALRYDFSRPPHAGPLRYEQLGFPITGESWRALAARLHGAGSGEISPQAASGRLRPAAARAPGGASPAGGGRRPSRRARG
jgi:N-acetylglucosamine malate deacetylase 2